MASSVFLQIPPKNKMGELLPPSIFLILSNLKNVKLLFRASFAGEPENLFIRTS